MAGAEFQSNRLKTAALHQTPEELKQARDINTALSALNACMRALAAKRSHVPFRNSKLTMVLRRFLTGECTVVGTLAPEDHHQAATTSTLNQLANLLK